MKRFIKTLYGKAAIVLFITLLFSLIVIWIHSITVTQYIQQQQLLKRQEDLAVYSSSVSTSFETLEEMLFYLPDINPRFQTLKQFSTSDNESAPEYWAAVSNIRQQISTFQSIFPFVERVFIYNPESGLFLNSDYNPQMTAIIKYSLSSRFSPMEYWNTADISGVSYLYRIFSSGGFYIGAWASCDKLASYFFPSSDSVLISNALYDLNGKPLVSGAALPVILPQDLGSSVQHSRRSITSVFADHPGIYLVSILDFGATSYLDSSGLISLVIVVLLHIFLFLFIMFAVHQWILKPVDELSFGISRIRGGEKTYRMPPSRRSSSEFEEVKTEFNAMMDETQQMRIQMYEQQLQQSEVRLRYLSQQIQPHFILNSLNMLHAYIGKEPDTAKNIVRLLVRYYRYIINIESKYVPIHEELEHIDNYLAFQKIRYGDRLTYAIHCDDDVSDTHIPPLLLESFVGNSLKYGQDENDSIFILIEVRRSEQNLIQIKIIDRGSGFPVEILDAVKQYTCFGEKDPLLGIGICNSIDRLKLIYGDQASVFLYNNPPKEGAIAEITVRADSAAALR